MTPLRLYSTHLHPRGEEGAGVNFGGWRASALSSRLFGRGASCGVIYTKTYTISHGRHDCTCDGLLQFLPSFPQRSRPLWCEVTVSCQGCSVWVLNPSFGCCIYSQCRALLKFRSLPTALKFVFGIGESATTPTSTSSSLIKHHLTALQPCCQIWLSYEFVEEVWEWLSG